MSRRMWATSRPTPIFLSSSYDAAGAAIGAGRPMNRQVLTVLAIAAAILLGLAFYRGWIPGAPDFMRIEAQQHR